MIQRSGYNDDRNTLIHPKRDRVTKRAGERPEKSNYRATRWKFDSSPVRAELDEKPVQKSLGTSRVIAKETGICTHAPMAVAHPAHPPSGNGAPGPFSV